MNGECREKIISLFQDLVFGIWLFQDLLITPFYRISKQFDFEKMFVFFASPNLGVVVSVTCFLSFFQLSQSSTLANKDFLLVPAYVVMAVQSVANIVKSSLGPVGLDKMIVDDIGVSRWKRPDQHQKCHGPC
jgi:hypothetical protein